MKTTARLSVLFAGFAATILCLLAYAFEPRFITSLADISRDVMLRCTPRPAPSSRLAIVDIDEASLARYGQWPWPRYLLAQLVDRLTEAGAGVIAFDMVFPEPDRTSPAEVQRGLDEHLGVETPAAAGQAAPFDDFDAMLAKSLASAVSVLGCYMEPDPGRGDVATVDTGADPHFRGTLSVRGKGRLADHIPRASDVTVSIPRLRSAATSSGFLNTIPDPDNLVRIVPLVWACGAARIYPSLALEAVRLYRREAQTVIALNPGGIESVQLGKTRIPTDGAGRLLVNFRALRADAAADGFSVYPRLGAVDVMAGNVGDRVKGKLIFVGTSAPGLRDLRSTPLSSDSSGVEIQATVADNILSEDFLRMPWWTGGLVASGMVFAGMLVTLLIWRYGAWLAFAGALAIAALSVAWSAAMLTAWGFVMAPVYMPLTVALVYPVLTTMRYWQQEKYARWVRQTFGAMVSPSVLSYMEQSPANLRLSGHRTEATILFADIEGFSGISEDLDPGQLQSMLNRYLTPMARIVMDRHGYVDRFQGDLMMAEWGVPFRVGDHAERACDAALAQLRALSDLNPALQADYGHTIKIRIGINTGEVTAGNLGSDCRFQYTVVGNTVNIAARLEPLNKEYGTTVLIGEETWRSVKDRFKTRFVDTVQLRGVHGKYRVYELLG